MHDLDSAYKSDDGSFTKDHYTNKWLFSILGLLDKIGLTGCPGPMLKKLVEEAGFINVEERAYKLPVGPWPRNPALKELGMINISVGLESLEAASLKPLSACGYSEDEISVLNAQVRRELKGQAFHAYYALYTVTGQKPEKPVESS